MYISCFPALLLCIPYGPLEGDVDHQTGIRIHVGWSSLVCSPVTESWGPPSSKQKRRLPSPIEAR